MDGKTMPIWARLAIVLVTVVAGVLVTVLLIGALGGVGEGNGSQGDTNEQAEPAQESAAQVFDTDAATVEYREELEPTQGNVMYSFALTNKTGSTVMVSADNVVVNGEFNVQALGGAPAPIEPGNTGSVSITFGYTVQTTLESMDQITGVSMDLVLTDNGTFEEVARIPVSVAL